MLPQCNTLLHLLLRLLLPREWCVETPLPLLMRCLLLLSWVGESLLLLPQPLLPWVETTLRQLQFFPLLLLVQIGQWARHTPGSGSAQCPPVLPQCNTLLHLLLRLLLPREWCVETPLLLLLRCLLLSWVEESLLLLPQLLLPLLLSRVGAALRQLQLPLLSLMQNGYHTPDSVSAQWCSPTLPQCNNRCFQQERRFLLVCLK